MQTGLRQLGYRVAPTNKGEALLHDWISRVGWEILLNRRGMMWRKLDQQQKDNIDEQSAISIMLSTPSIIKRPVLVKDDLILVGFDEDKYKELN